MDGTEDAEIITDGAAGVTAVGGKPLSAYQCSNVVYRGEPFEP